MRSQVMLYAYFGVMRLKNDGFLPTDFILGPTQLRYNTENRDLTTLA